MNTMLRFYRSHSAQQLLTEMQSLGLRLDGQTAEQPGRGGSGSPSGQTAVTIDGKTIMVPMHTDSALESPFFASPPNEQGVSDLRRNGLVVAQISFPPHPRFYGLQTLDGVPYWKIAELHGADVLVSTVLQNCVRCANRKTACQFCAIGDPLAEGRTIEHKTPHQLAEVARAAVLLDGVKHMVMTTGTPNFTDRGAKILCDSAFAVKTAVDLPIQVQCEPPDDNAWFARLQDVGVDSMAMRLDAVTSEVRARIIPGKAVLSVAHYLEAFELAVRVFGRGQVSTCILAGLGDSADAILRVCEELIDIGVYPFVVPFVPLSGTPLASHPAPTPELMQSILGPLGIMLANRGLRSRDIKAGCGRCGACSTLSTYEA